MGVQELTPEGPPCLINSQDETVTKALFRSQKIPQTDDLLLI
jgi:hypothetical protein